MKTFKLLPLFAAMQAAFAGAPDAERKPIDPIVLSPEASSSSVSGSRASSSSEAVSTATAGSDASSSATASSGDSSAAASNEGNTLNNSTVYKQRRQAPAVVTAATNTTAACQGEWHVGLSAGVGGVSFGKSRTVRDCVLDQAADKERDLGNLEASIRLRCRISFYAEALGEDCPALLNSLPGDGSTGTEAAAKRTKEQRDADRARLLQQVSK